MAVARQLTTREEAVASNLVDELMGRWIGTTQIDPRSLLMIRCQLDDMSAQRHAADPFFPQGMKWRVHAVATTHHIPIYDHEGQKVGMNTETVPTGEVIARLIEIAGEEIEWPTTL